MKSVNKPLTKPAPTDSDVKSPTAPIVDRGVRIAAHEAAERLQPLRNLLSQDSALPGDDPDPTNSLALREHQESEEGLLRVLTRESVKVEIAFNDDLLRLSC